MKYKLNIIIICLTLIVILLSFITGLKFNQTDINRFQLTEKGRVIDTKTGDIYTPSSGGNLVYKKNLIKQYYKQKN